MGGCADEETEVVQDTNSFDKSVGSQTCTGGTQSYCCKGFLPSPSGSDLLDQAEDAAKAAAEAAAEQAALGTYSSNRASYLDLSKNGVEWDHKRPDSFRSILPALQ